MCNQSDTVILSIFDIRKKLNSVHLCICYVSSNAFLLLMWHLFASHSSFCLVLCLSDACVFQTMNGCEWDDKTADTKYFNKYGYNGEDFITLDLKTLTWVAHTPEAIIIKQDWDRDTSRIMFWNYTFTYECLHYLKMYVACGNSSLWRTGRVT